MAWLAGSGTSKNLQNLSPSSLGLSKIPKIPGIPRNSKKKQYISKDLGSRPTAGLRLLEISTPHQWPNHPHPARLRRATHGAPAARRASFAYLCGTCCRISSRNIRIHPPISVPLVPLADRLISTKIDKNR